MRALIFTLLLTVSTNAFAKKCGFLFEKPMDLSTVFSLENGFYPDFNKVKINEFIPTLKVLIQNAQNKINGVKVSKTSFENTILGLEDATSELERYYDLIGIYINSYKTDDVKSIEIEISDLIKEFYVTVFSSPELFKRVSEIYDSRTLLTQEQELLAKSYYDSFINGGAKLNDLGRKSFKKLNLKLGQVQIKFEKNLDIYSDKFEYLITNTAELTGLPEALIESLAHKAKTQGKTGYLVTLEPNVVMDILKNSENDHLKKLIYLAYNRKAYKSKGSDNTKVVYEIESLQQQIAKLLGYPNAAALKLSSKMAKNIETVKDFTEKLRIAYKPFAEKEEQELVRFINKKTGSKQYEIWNRDYWVYQLKKEKFNYDEEKIKEYLMYDNVKGAVFKLVESIYGITFYLREDLPKPHPDTEVYEIKDGNQTLGYLIEDPFSRLGTKRTGAWASNIGQTYIRNGKKRPGVFTINMNYSKPVPGKPTLLSVSDAETYLHEMGHALHGLLSNVNYRGVAGTNVKWDIVELPSQFMEGFLFEREFLNWFAYNSKRELLPDSLLKTFLNAQNHWVANTMLRQLGFSLIDMAWFTGEFRQYSGSISEIEKQILKPVTVFHHNESTTMSTMFAHIMTGGYTAGYYSYKWAELYSVDAFAIFKNEGLFNRDTGERFRRNFLQVGGSIEPQIAYRNFAGRPPEINSLLRRDGLIP